MPKAPEIKLNNGNTIPAIGMGVVFLDSEGDLQKTVDSAIEAGYRLFDNAAFYGNEKEIGQALKNNGIAREELFISSKLKCGHHKYEEALAEFDKSLNRLGVDYLDMYLIHFPCPEHGLYTEAWKALEHLYKEGVVKNIGVSNFEISHLEKIFEMCEIKPVIDQLECNPYLSIAPLRAYLKEHDVIPEAWFPIGGGKVRLDGLPNEFKDQLFEEPVFGSLGEKYGKSAAQIILRWETQRGILPVPKAANLQHLQENINIFDFEMTEDELAQIDALNKDYRMGPSGDDVNEYWE